MDKYEYQVCADQIKSLIANHRFAEAMDIADTIDWRRVKSFSMLCTVSEIYKVNKHYDESRDILLLAYERYPDRPNVVYALCELAVKLNDIAEAVDYYKEFVRIRPNDTNRYVLLYKIYDAQEVPIEERIALLEEFRRTEYTEKWAYELACLYHKNGQERKCIEECDELILWFGEGPYVRKAMELKMQHTELTEEQQMKYDGVESVSKPSPSNEAVNYSEQYQENQYPNNQYQDSQYQNNQYQNDQYQNNQYQNNQYQGDPYQNNQQYYQPEQQNMYEQSYSADSQVAQAYVTNNQAAQDYASNDQARREYVQNDQYVIGSDQPYDPTYTYQDIQVQPVNTDKYSTLNLQEELAKNMAEIYEKGNVGISAPYYGETAQLYEPSQRQYIESLQAYGQNNNFAQSEAARAQAPLASNEKAYAEEKVHDEVEMAQAVDEIMGYKPNLAEAPMQAETEMLAMQARPENTVIEAQPQVQEVAVQPQVQAAAVQPQVQEVAVQPQVQEVVAQPQVQEVVAQPQVQATAVQPQVQVAAVQPQVQVAAVQPQVQAEVAQPQVQAAAVQPQVQAAAVQPQVQAVVAQPQVQAAAVQPQMQAEEAPSHAVLQAQAEAKYTEEQLKNLAKLEKVLTQDGGGQISLSFPLDEAVEKQITGQIDISDFLQEWNAKKKSKEEQRRKELREKSLSQTSDIMAQLAGVIPGIEEAVMPREVENKAKPIIPIDNIGKNRADYSYEDDSIGKEDNVKRTESGSKINGLRVSEITGAIPSVLPSKTPSKAEVEAKEAQRREAERVEAERREAERKEAERREAERREAERIEAERKEAERREAERREAERIEAERREAERIEAERIEAERREVERIEAEQNEIELRDPIDELEGVIPTGIPEVDYVSNHMEPTVAVAEGVIGEVETKPVDGKREIEDVSFESSDIVEEMEDVDVRELPDELVDDEQTDSFEDELPIPEGEGIPAVNQEKDNTAYEEMYPEDSSEYPEEDTDNADDVEEEKKAFPYELEDDYLGEIEEIELIDQPDDVDDMLKTGKLPIEDITAYGEYGGMDDGVFSGYEPTTNTNESAPTGHPSYMVMGDAPVSRRDFDPEEMAIFGRFEGIEALKAQIVDAVDDMSMDARRGNVVVFGSELYGRKLIAIDVVKAMQVMDSEFSGKVAKISGEALNKKNIPMTLEKLAHGALIVENAGGLTPITVNTITDTLINDVDSILVVFEGDKDTLEPLLMGCNQTRKVFNASITIPEFNNNDLVSYGKGYARELEYSIDEMGELALHTRISDMQTIDHIVSVDEVQEIVDAAIHHVDRKNMSHFMDVLVGKRYDEEDYIVLREKDFTSI